MYLKLDQSDLTERKREKLERLLDRHKTPIDLEKFWSFLKSIGLRSFNPNVQIVLRVAGSAEFYPGDVYQSYKIVEI